ncbi:hypothetical protein DLJ82_6148 (plasmid) [Rhizobium leguminosarum]|uniref:Type IV conjugative transfer protein TrbJ/K C-terminal domain-containing protein n=1 Tax=Rhizobium leguminosarum TaxID=384 RepID=A0A2Z4YSS7_RHILE|nr:hypothetical protein DLJ82_6148 [Rhizobium leguminosarum]
MSRVYFMILVIATAEIASAASWVANGSPAPHPRDLPEEQRGYRDRFFGSRLEEPLMRGQGMRPRW